MPYIEALRASAEVVTASRAPATAATPEESEKVLRWLEGPGVRIVEVDKRFYLRTDDGADPHDSLGELPRF